ncbi:MAG: hypothetical protein LBU42_08240 [Prevotellaceae bacterium]|jgi:hypothetical protein|nr:hypothetical protein [Prevotellaceae bacterium]
MKANKQIEPTFRVIDYVRQVRAEMNELYQQDKAQYLARLNASMSDFLRRQSGAHSSHSFNG